MGGKKILLLGSGFGGTYTLRHLVRSLNRNENVETTMVSDENFFLFSPLLHEVAMGSIETRHIAYPIRRLHWRDRFNFVQANVDRIDLGNHKVITSVGTLDFDYLVMALGSVTDMSGLPSLHRNVFTLKTLRDSMLIRNHIIGVFERASIQTDCEKQRELLTFVVCGGGYTGVQLVSELRSLILGSLTRFYKAIDPTHIRIILVEAGDKIAAELHSKLSYYVMGQLEKMNIEIKLKSRLTHVSDDRVVINSTEVVPTITVIWVAGVTANPRIAELDVEKDSTGRVFVNSHLELPEFHGIYAIGDCAHFVDSESGLPIPPRAHTAAAQAKIAAKNILADIRGTDKKRYRHTSRVEMISLGRAKAVCRFGRLWVYGFIARLIWLAAYSALVSGTSNRARIIVDWLLSLVFGRDTTLLRIMK